MPIKWKGNAARKKKIAMGDCNKFELERVGEEWRKGDIE